MRHPEQVRILNQVLIALSFMATIFAIYGYFGSDFWLASTQWLIIAIVLGIWAIFFTVDMNKK